MEITEAKLFEMLGRLYAENMMLRQAVLAQASQNGTSTEPVPEKAEVQSSLTTS